MAEQNTLSEEPMNFDGAVTPEDRREISRLERELQTGSRFRCPSLQSIGQFYYCAKGMPKSPYAPSQQHVGLRELDLVCLSQDPERFKGCCFYKGHLTRGELSTLLKKQV